MTLVDTNILIDILSGDPLWSEISIKALSTCASAGSISINEIIYAELASGFESRTLLDQEVDKIGLAIARLSEDALFLAGQAFRRYRAGGGMRPNVLADFFIGAQARAEGWPILTRDARRYRTYFPAVRIITPNGS